MNMFKLKGKVDSIGKTKNVTEKFKKRDLILLVEADKPEYNELIQFEAKQDKCLILDGVSKGDDIEVSFIISGRKWKNPEGRVSYFNSLYIFGIDKFTKSGKQVEVVPEMSSQQQPDPLNLGEPEDDLPF